MADIADITPETPVFAREDHAMKARIFRVMVSATGLAIAISSLIGPWRFTAGLAIGGVLALFSHNWLRNSAAAAIRVAAGGGVQQLRLLQFLLRYIVIGSVVFAAYYAELASLSGMLLGMSSFVVAVFFEAAREFYFAIIHREEIT
jgi:hypothetical protein